MNLKNILLISVILIILSVSVVSATDLNNTYVSEPSQCSDDSITVEHEKTFHTEDLNINYHLQTSNVDNKSLSNSHYENKNTGEMSKCIDNSDILKIDLQSSNSLGIGKSNSIANAPADFTGLQELINNAKENSVINLDKDYNYKTGTDKKDGILITKNNITINGNGHTINSNKNSRAFIIKGNNVTLTNLNIINGNSYEGSAVLWSGENGILTNCQIANHYARSRGAVTWEGKNGTMNNTKFTNNYADCGAAIWWKDMEICGRISNCQFTNNKANLGGAVLLSGYGSIINSTFINNNAKYGGAIGSRMPLQIIDNCLFENNTASKEGSAIRTYGSHIIKNSRFLHNKESARFEKENGKLVFKFYKEYESKCEINSICGPGLDKFINVTYYFNGKMVNTDKTNPICTKGIPGENITIEIYSDINELIDKHTYTTDNEGKISYCNEWKLTNGKYHYKVYHLESNDVLYAEQIGNITISGKGNFSHLEDIIDNLGDNNVINLYNNLTFTMGIDKTYITIKRNNIVINGNGRTINALNQTGIFHITGRNVKITNLTLINGVEKTYLQKAGAIYTQGINTVISNCNFENNEGLDGGAIYTGRGTVIENCNIKNCKASKGGAIFTKDETVIKNCNFTNNKVALHGGAIYTGNKNVIENCNFISNNATSEGGAIVLSKNNKILNCNFENNSAYVAGAIILSESSTDNYINCCNFKNNIARENGIIYSEGDNLIINHTTFTDNKVDTEGIITIINSKIQLNNCEFENNSAKAGGALNLKNSKNFVLQNCKFENNKAYDGGAIYCADANGRNINCKFINNTAYNGGAIYSNSHYEVIENEFTGNNALNGGAIYCTNADQMISNSKFTNNNAYNGAALYCNCASSKITNCRFINNTLIGEQEVKYAGNGTNQKIVNENIEKFNGAIFANPTSQLTIKKSVLNNSEYEICNYGELILEKNNLANFIYNGGKILSETKITVGNNSIINLNQHSTLNLTAVIKDDSNNIIIQELPLKFIIDNDYNISSSLNREGTFWAKKLFDNGGIHKIFVASEGYENVKIYESTVCCGEFAYLQQLINDAPENSVINLTRNITYCNGFDLENAIQINKNKLTIKGNGYTIDAKEQCGIFNIAKNNVILENMKIINAKYIAIKYSGANGIISNCVFTNDSTFNRDEIELNDLSSVICIDKKGKHLTVKNSIFNNDCKYEIRNYGELSLENNTLSKIIYNAGNILSKTQITVENNSTVAFSYSKTLNITAVITDDNNNIITLETPMKFWFNKEIKDSSVNSRCTFWTEKEFKGGIYKISASHEGLKNASVKIHFVCIGDFNYLQHLINAAGDNSVIKLLLYRDYRYIPLSDNNLENGIEVRNNNITIDGNGIKIDAKSYAKIFNIYGDNVKLINFKITNANIETITWNGNNGLISNCTFYKNNIKNNAYYGGAVNWNGNNGTISACSFEDNDAYYGGAVNWNGENGTISKCSFKNNHANTGGAIYWQGKYGKITESTFTDNQAKTGGAIYWNSYSGEIKNSTLTNNKAVECYAIDCESSNTMITNITALNNNKLTDTQKINSFKMPGPKIPDLPKKDIKGPKIPHIDITGPKIQASTIVIKEPKIPGAGITIITKKNAAIYIAAKVNCTIKESILENNCDYEISNFGELNLKNNKLTNNLYNSGNILSKTNITIKISGKNEKFDDPVIELDQVKTLNITASMKDDNGNTIIQDNSVNLLLGKKIIQKNPDKTVMSKEKYGFQFVKTFNEEADYIITAENPKLKNASINKKTIHAYGQFTRLQRLIDSAPENSVINLKQNYTYSVGLDTGNAILINKNNITIKGNGHTVNAKNKSIFKISGNYLVLNNMTITNGKSTAINWNGNNGSISSCSFENNEGYCGGAVNWKGDNGTISKCSFKDNHANTGGAIYWQGKYGKITESTLTDNQAKTGGAIYWNGYSGEIRNSTLTNNKAVKDYSIDCESDNLMMINIISINNMYLKDTKLVDSIGLSKINVPKIPGAGIDIHTPRIPGTVIDITGPKIP